MPAFIGDPVISAIELSGLVKSHSKMVRCGLRFHRQAQPGTVFEGLFEIVEAVLVGKAGVGEGHYAAFHWMFRESIS